MPDAGDVEGAREEVARYGVGGGGGLDGVQGAAVELWGVVLVSGRLSVVMFGGGRTVGQDRPATGQTLPPLHLALPWLEGVLDVGAWAG